MFAKQKKQEGDATASSRSTRSSARLRLNPTSKRPNLRVGATDVVGRGNGRSLILAVRNTGNTLDPVAGTVKITGPTGRNATIPPVSVVPGQVVYLKGGALSGMKGGNYTATWSITQGSKRYTAKRTVQALRSPCVRDSAVQCPPPVLHCTLESEVMEELWARSEATVREVQEALNARGGKVRAYTTLLTVMTRLDAKGLLVRRRAGRLDVYAPAIARDAYLQARAEAEVARAGRGLRRPRARALRAPHRHARPGAAGEAPPAGER